MTFKNAKFTNSIAFSSSLFVLADEATLTLTTAEFTDHLNISAPLFTLGNKAEMTMKFIGSMVRNSTLAISFGILRDKIRNEQCIRE